MIKSQEQIKDINDDVPTNGTVSVLEAENKTLLNKVKNLEEIANENKEKINELKSIIDDRSEYINNIESELLDKAKKIESLENIELRNKQLRQTFKSTITQVKSEMSSDSQKFEILIRQNNILKKEIKLFKGKFICFKDNGAALEDDIKKLNLPTEFFSILMEKDKLIEEQNTIIENRENEITSLIAQLSNLEKDIAEIKDNKNGHENGNGNGNGNGGSNASELEKLLGMLQIERSKVEKLIDMNESLKEDRAEFVERSEATMYSLKEMLEKTADTGNELGKLKKQNFALIKEQEDLNLKISEIENELRSLEEEKNSIKDELKNTQNLSEIERQKNSRLLEKFNLRKEQVFTLKTKLDTANKKIQALQEENRELEKQTLKGKIKEENARVEIMKKKLEKTQLAGKETAVKYIQAMKDNKTLGQEIKALKTKYEKTDTGANTNNAEDVKKKLDELKIECNALRGQHTNAQRQVKELVAAVKGLQANVKRKEIIINQQEDLLRKNKLVA